MHHHVQVVMGMLLAALDMKVPLYIRTDAFVVSHRRLQASPQEDDGPNGAAVELQVTSPHGPRCPMPMLSHAIFSFPVSSSKCTTLLESTSSHVHLDKAVATAMTQHAGRHYKHAG